MEKHHEILCPICAQFLFSLSPVEMWIFQYVLSTSFPQGSFIGIKSPKSLFHISTAPTTITAMLFYILVL
ncbi:hypothetical protein SELSPUOL_01329 [Selenomonas sputigena ATCC 35185]|uniref:Uncharacterized protein n=1 Tax=Selenomonas sputigena (strain ATCC 35185 / DSM 20758 / CCUG 44933 / VPI D19B-28) TaxID=546271 RepID=C9LV39_SELS3|nr:hypothetical protein SELSPUOL_01329 [Selenomonas sputigena ATCC 35185]